MKWVAFKIAIDGIWIGHEPCAMESGDRLGVRQPGRDDFASAGITGHEMRFHQSGDDLKVRIHEPFVETHNRAAGRRRPEQDVILVPGGVMILDPYSPQDPRIADQFLQLGAEVGSMQAGGHQHPNARGRDPALSKIRSADAETDGSVQGA